MQRNPPIGGLGQDVPTVLLTARPRDYSFPGYLKNPLTLALWLGRLRLYPILFSSSLILSSLELSDTKVYAPYIRARLGTAAHFFEVVVPHPRPPGPGRPRLSLSHPRACASSLLLSSLELSDTKVYEPEIQALLGTASKRRGNNI